MIRLAVIVATSLLVAGCKSNCNTGFKEPLYFHTHDSDLACQSAERHK